MLNTTLTDHDELVVGNLKGPAELGYWNAKALLRSYLGRDKQLIKSGS